jgi:maltose O-acetyltransferase
MLKFKFLFSNIFRFFFPLDIVTMYKRMGVKIGKNCNFQNEVIIDHSHNWLVEIGDNVILAPRVHILAHDASTKIFLNYTRIGKIKIGNNVFIGAGTIILPGIEIGNNVVIGAGSIVTKSIPSDSVYSGNPAKLICSLEEFLEKHRKLMKTNPMYDESYTLRGNLTQAKKIQMIEEIVHLNKTGYVI